ncbi:hypothetical protein IF188_08980 [Microbacterium sp. NEAU-LLC]|uniref:DUF559 domain-containing protein n=1 Tax=Microbacterium helvum TaxID=2773713 RepID=A0ABR8NMD6_9MICO|nr:hypothetical protein [Microbacterium helvum]MBD3941825.1 hypothetical protein [Microbacterium helvum]
MRATDLDRPFHGVRGRPPAPKTDDRRDDEPAPTRWDAARAVEKLKAQAFATVMPPQMFFAGRTAAVLQGAPIDPGDQIVVGVLAPDRAPRATGVRGVKVASKLAFVHTHDGLRMTTPASTWAMLGAELSTRELVALGDWFVRVPRDERGRLQPGLQLATIDHLERAVEAGRRVGVAKLRDALPLIRVGSSSPLETEFRIDAAAGGLPEPALDVEIRDAAGTLLGITEVVYRDQRVGVEVEGDHHRTSRAQWERDIDKYASYAAEGWEVVRLTSKQIRGARPTAVAIVRAALVRRGWTPS